MTKTNTTAIHAWKMQSKWHFPKKDLLHFENVDKAVKIIVPLFLVIHMAAEWFVMVQGEGGFISASCLVVDDNFLIKLVETLEH